MRKAFFRDYLVDWKERGKFGEAYFSSHLKEKSTLVDIALPKEITDIFQELLNQKDDTLRELP